MKLGADNEPYAFEWMKANPGSKAFFIVIQILRKKIFVEIPELGYGASPTDML